MHSGTVDVWGWEVEIVRRLCIMTFFSLSYKRVCLLGTDNSVSSAIATLVMQRDRGSTLIVGLAILEPLLHLSRLRSTSEIGIATDWSRGLNRAVKIVERIRVALAGRGASEARTILTVTCRRSRGSRAGAVLTRNMFFVITSGWLPIDRIKAAVELL